MCLTKRCVFMKNASSVSLFVAWLGASGKVRAESHFFSIEYHLSLGLLRWKWTNSNQKQPFGSPERPHDQPGSWQQLQKIEMNRKLIVLLFRLDLLLSSHSAFLALIVSRRN